MPFGKTWLLAPLGGESKCGPNWKSVQTVQTYCSEGEPCEYRLSSIVSRHEIASQKSEYTAVSDEEVAENSGLC